MSKITSIKKIKPTFQDIKQWYDNYLDPKLINHNDQQVYKNVYHEGRFPGIFQLSSRGAQKFFIQAKPTSITDIAALTSIYRPGPLAAKVDKLWIECSEKSYDWGHPLINETLKETRGLLIFQEGVMALANRVGGFPLDQTDEVRRAIMKRNISAGAELVAKAKALEDDFINGAEQKGVPRTIAHDAYQRILWMAGYGFNKSHAVAYAFDSYFCAWLLTYYEKEWLTAYLESMSNNPDDKAVAFSEIKQLGYKIVPIDINIATDSWQILPGKRFMPSITSMKGVGDSAVQELLSYRPYKQFEDILWSPETGEWRPSKLNKKALSALINTGAFESLNCVGEDKLFSSYAHMYHVVIDNLDEIKKSTKKEPYKGKNEFYRLCKEERNIEPWTRKELTLKYIECFGSLDVNTLLDKEVLQVFENKGIKSLDEFDGQNIYWFCVVQTVQKKTKNGKLYHHLTVQGQNGKLYKMFCWGVKPTDTIIEDYSICFAELTRSDFGYATQRFKLRIIE